MFRKRSILFLCFYGFLFIPNGYSENPIRFDRRIFRFEGDVADVIVEDLNNDSAPDMIVVHNQTTFPDPHTKRILSLFLQQEGRFPDQANQTLLLENNEIVFDIGDLDGDSFQDLVFLKNDGVYIRQNNGNEFSERLKLFQSIQSAFLLHDPSRINRFRFIRDVDGDGVPEMIIPKANQMSVLSKNPFNGYDEKVQLWTAPELILPSDSDPFTFSVRFPFFHLQDFNGDRITDFLIQSADRLDVYIQHPGEENGSRIGLIPPDLRYRMAARNVNPPVLNQITDPTMSVEVEDLNGDGYVDILLTRPSRTHFTTHISQIQVYINQYGRFDLIPNQVLTLENFGGEHVIGDFNHDGLLDLGMLDFRIGFSQALKFLLTKKASSAYLFYLMRADGRYPHSPDKKISFSRKVNLNDILGSELCQSFRGDFNGDGLNDFLIGTDTNKLSVYIGLKEDLFSEKAMFQIETMVSSHLWVGDVNQDGYSDILFWYPDDSNLSHQVILIQCSGGDSK